MTYIWLYILLQEIFINFIVKYLRIFPKLGKFLSRCILCLLVLNGTQGDTESDTEDDTQMIPKNKLLTAEQKQEKAPTMYYASVAYLQTTDATERLDKFKNDGNYDALLTETKEYDQGDDSDLSKINLSATKYRGDDLLIEDEHYAVVYNPTVGGTYDVMRKVSAEEIKDNIIRYGLPEDATDDVKEVAKQMEREEVVTQEEEQHYHRGR